ncbi:MAG TPA: acetyl/propionyl/methylcrotonyl-CoA carboxylase subunit alpha [Pseudolabrys sp.]|nr:acetyl/propionyl/methylcrotonyl-CoA carboxylase subunit alpha [Pseudolabrys sp.]
MFKSVLIANRGEIACRIARTARRMGLRSIAVYSDADAGALHVRQCDEAYPIGPAPAAESYLVIEKLIATAKRAGAECIHPGYGFLSENADFAEACLAAGMSFVGPPAEAIRNMGLKHQAKALMEKAGVPVVPGYHGEMQEPKFLKQKAYEIGYPVIIKALAGGGGKGMRRVDRHADFDTALESAQREASSSFGDARVLIEKYVTRPRHIEMQIFADGHGNVIHLGERDCSLQRRHQKVVEEAPAPGMTAALRARMGAAAVAAAKAVGYIGAGTVEFIADATDGLKAGGFWFMEMNTRLQVEHPVTEAVTGLDLVEWQFRVAGGEKLPLAQDLVAWNGHAIEARIYAEDPERGFLPSTGRLVGLRFPNVDGLRIDTGVEGGSEVTPFYDPMIAKLIAHGKDRADAFERLTAALEQTVIAGPRSNVGFLTALCRARAVRKGDFDTGFIDANLAELCAVPQGLDRAAAAFGVQHLLDQPRPGAPPAGGVEAWVSPWDATDAFQISGIRRLMLPIVADGQTATAEIVYRPEGRELRVDGVAAAQDAVAICGPDTVYVLRHGRQTTVSMRDPALVEAGDLDRSGLVRAPMHGKVLALLVEEGARVTRGQRIAVIEAMKMEHTIVAPVDGTVASILVSKDSQVAEGAKMMLIAPAKTGNATTAGKAGGEKVP